MPRAEAGGGKTGTYGASLSTLHAIDVNRAYGYLGSLDAGYLRVGKTDSAFTLLQSGVIEAFGDGGQWTLQGGVASLLPRNAAPLATVVYADQPAVYSTFKLVYVFPAFHGISVMAGFEPRSNGIKEGFSPNAPGQPREPMRSWRPGDAAYKRKNTVDAALSYAGNAGAVSYKVSAGALYGHAVDRLAPGDGLEAETGFNSLVVYQVGGQASYAGVTFGANLKGGQVEDNYGLQPAGARNALAYILGATYQLGPAILGASYFNSQSSGAYLPNTDVTVARTLSEYGAAAGANYIINQHLNLFLQYLYGHRHQPGNAELIAGNAQVQVIAAGGTFSW
jgi:predicted porin